MFASVPDSMYEGSSTQDFCHNLNSVEVLSKCHTHYHVTNENEYFIVTLSRPQKHNTPL